MVKVPPLEVTGERRGREGGGSASEFDDDDERKKNLDDSLRFLRDSSLVEKQDRVST